MQTLEHNTNSEILDPNRQELLADLQKMDLLSAEAEIMPNFEFLESMENVSEEMKADFRITYRYMKVGIQELQRKGTLPEDYYLDEPETYAEEIAALAPMYDGLEKIEGSIPKIFFKFDGLVHDEKNDVTTGNPIDHKGKRSAGTDRQTKYKSATDQARRITMGAGDDNDNPLFETKMFDYAEDDFPENEDSVRKQTLELEPDTKQTLLAFPQAEEHMSEGFTDADLVAHFSPDEDSYFAQQLDRQLRDREAGNTAERAQPVTQIDHEAIWTISRGREKSIRGKNGQRVFEFYKWDSHLNKIVLRSASSFEDEVENPFVGIRPTFIAKNYIKKSPEQSSESLREASSPDIGYVASIKTVNGGHGTSYKFTKTKENTATPPVVTNEVVVSADIRKKEVQAKYSKASLTAFAEATRAVKELMPTYQAPNKKLVAETTKRFQRWFETSYDGHDEPTVLLVPLFDVTKEQWDDLVSADKHMDVLKSAAAYKAIRGVAESAAQSGGVQWGVFIFSKQHEGYKIFGELPNGDLFDVSLNIEQPKKS